MNAAIRNFVATRSELLMLLAEGRNLAWMADRAGWRTRQIRLFGSRNGYLFSANGTPYRPKTFGERPGRGRPHATTRTP